MWRTGVQTAGIALAGALAPLAFLQGLYATATLMVCMACGLGVAVIAQVARATRAPLIVEHRPTRPSDRAAQAMRALLDHAPVPLLTMAPDGALHAANRAARRLFATDDRIVDPAPSLVHAIATLDPGARRTIRLKGRAGSGLRSYALMVAQAGGQPGLSALVALTDIEAELNASEAQALRELLQVLSHEIMNSLTPVVSLAQSVHDMMEEGCDPAAVMPQARDAIGVILRRTRGLDRFVQGYRTLARLPVPVLRQTRVQDVIAQCAMLFRTRWGATCALAIAPDAAVAHARLDPELLEQALICLLTNGAEAALAGRAASLGAMPTVDLAVIVDRDGVCIRVGDNGDGVPADQRQAIFRAFVSLKDGGDGIGLSLARQIVQDHGGSLSLDDARPGEGAVFLIRL